MFLKFKSSGTYIEFVSSLPIEECIRRIRDNADENSIGILPVIGEFEATSFQLRKRSLLGNRFQTILTAQLVGMQNGKTILACHFGPKPFSGALILTIGFLLFAIVLFVGGAIFNPPRSGVVGVMEGISVPAAMLALIAASYALGRFIARNEGSFLTEFLRETAQIEHDFGRHSGKN